MERFYLMRVGKSLKCARLGLDDGDEELLYMAAYHVQQAAEYGLKQLLIDCGVSYTKTHSISALINKVPEWQTYVSQETLDALMEKAYMLTEWEAMTRYDASYVNNRRMIEKMYLMLVDFEEELRQGLEGSDEVTQETPNKPAPSALKTLDLFKDQRDK